MSEDLFKKLEENTPYSEKHRFSAPIMERIGFLYANGNSNDEIWMIVSQEFNDVVGFPITFEMVRTVVSKNQEYFKRKRKEMGEIFQKDIECHAVGLLEKTKKKEEKMVTVFADKMDEALDQLGSLDLSEQDDKGNYKNTSRAFTLVEFVDKLQTKISKITGSDAMREVAVFRAKLEAKNESDSGGSMGLPPMRDANAGMPSIN